MSKKLFTSKEIEQLKHNQYVKSVSAKGITYTKEFRENFITMNQKGQLPREIFEHHGFDISVLGMQRVASAAKRWRHAYREQGALGLDDQRAKCSGRPRVKELTIEEENLRLKAKLEMLKVENELLKKLRLMRKMLE